jgi:hypothetical protein
VSIFHVTPLRTNLFRGDLLPRLQLGFVTSMKIVFILAAIFSRGLNLFLLASKFLPFASSSNPFVCHNATPYLITSGILQTFTIRHTITYLSNFWTSKCCFFIYWIFQSLLQSWLSLQPPQTTASNWWKDSPPRAGPKKIGQQQQTPWSGRHEPTYFLLSSSNLISNISQILTDLIEDLAIKLKTPESSIRQQIDSDRIAKGLEPMPPHEEELRGLAALSRHMPKVEEDVRHVLTHFPQF